MHQCNDYKILALVDCMQALVTPHNKIVIIVLVALQISVWQFRESSIYTSANSFDIIITIILLSLSTMPKQKLAAIPYRHLDDKSPSLQLHKDSQSMESINAAQSTRENQLEKIGHTWKAWEVEMAKFIFVNFLVSMHFEAWNFFVYLIFKYLVHHTWM